MAAVIEAKNLTKRYGNFCAVKDLNLKISDGEVFGFLGPNGAGKTTTIAMLIGILYPTKGSVSLFGRNFCDDYFNLKRRIGVVSEQQYMYNNMTAYEYLSFFADLYMVKNKKERINEILKFVELYEHRDKLLGQYSKGMRQKISISRALINDPDILFLDEPAYGLDPVGVKEVRDIIMHQKDEGKTIFISSHILSEIEKVCDEVGIINKGVLIKRGNINQLKLESGGNELKIEVDKLRSSIVESLKKFNFIKDIEPDYERNILKIKTTDENNRAKISRCIFENGSTIIGMSMERATLEDVFVEITRVSGGGAK